MRKAIAVKPLIREFLHRLGAALRDLLPIILVIVAALKPNVTDRVVEAAKACGISGATIVPGRGTGMHEAKTFLGLTLEAQTDVVFFLAEEELVQPVMAAIRQAG